MKIEHIAIWVKDLEKMKDFYVKYFDVIPSHLYHNQTTGFKSYFLMFDSGARLEIMNRDDINKENISITLGFAHIAISLGSKEKVDEYTQIIKNDGYHIVSYPRTTGDGYYESVISDPEGNLVELTV